MINTTSSYSWKTYIAIFAGVVGFYCLGYYFLVSRIPETDHEFWAHRGQFGDMFGAINALFSGLAFAGIIVTILLQREELALQRKELADTRDVLEQQSNTLKLQRFDNTFYNLLTVHYQLIEGLVSSSGETKGREVLTQILVKWKSNLNALRIIDFNANHYSTYVTMYRSHLTGHYYDYISHYLQSLRGLHELVKTSSLINKEDHEHYFGILKASMSYPERRFLYYHIILGDSPDGTSSALRYLEDDLKVIGTVGKQDLLSPSHERLLEMYASRT